MRRLISIIIFFAITAQHPYAQDYAADRIPLTLKSRASAIVRQENIHIHMKSGSNVSEQVTRAVTILNTSGDNYGEINLYYNKGKAVKKINGTIFDESGRPIRKFGTKDFSDYSITDQTSMYNDVRVKHFNPNIHTYPYTIVYTYEIKHHQNLFIPYWKPNIFPDIAVEHSMYQFTCPPDQEIRIKEENIPYPVVTTDTDKEKTYMWRAENLHARKREPFSPIHLPEEIGVKIVPKDFYFFKKKGQIANWRDLGKWIYEELLKDKNDLSQTTRAEVQNIISQYTTPEEKARALYEYMQRKTRYISIQVGIGGIEPFPASYVDRLGYGDCKALVNYMHCLLAEADISSYYCVVEAGNTKIDLDKDFANIIDGNHIILYIPFANDTTWLECTNNKAPFGFLGGFTDDRLVLACSPEGGKLLHTPKYDVDNNRQIRQGTLTIDSSGSLTGTIQTLFSGTQFDNRFSHITLPPLELNRALKETYDIDNILFNTVKYHTDHNDTTIKIIEDIDLHIRHYVVKNGNHIILQPNIFNRSRTIPESRNRKNDVYINRGYTDEDRLDFILSEPIQGDIVPVHKILTCPMAKYELKITPAGDKISFFRQMAVRDGTYTADDYSRFFDFMRQVSAMDGGKYNLPLATE